MPYGITQCYLPPGRGDIPAFTRSIMFTVINFSDCLRCLSGCVIPGNEVCAVVRARSAAVAAADVNNSA